MGWLVCFAVLTYFIDFCLFVCLLCFGIFTSFVSSCSYCLTGVQCPIPQNIRYGNDTDLVKSVPFKYIPSVVWVIPMWDVADQADVWTFLLILHYKTLDWNTWREVWPLYCQWWWCLAGDGNIPWRHNLCCGWIIKEKYCQTFIL